MIRLFFAALAKGFNVCFFFPCYHCMSVSAVLIRVLNFCVLFIFSCNLQGFLIVYSVIVLLMYLSDLASPQLAFQLFAGQTI